MAASAWLVGASSGYANFTYETFDTGLGTWTTESPYNHIEGFDIGWSSTGNASGVGGEVGGTWARIDKKDGNVTAPRMAHILDTASFAGGNQVSLNMPLSASGRMILYDSGTADCTVYVGFYNSGILSYIPPGYPTNFSDAGSERLILRITGPASGSLWRFNFGGPNTTQSPTRVTVPDSTWSDTPLDFSFTWTPSGLNDGSGTVSGYVQKAGGGAKIDVPTWTIVAGAPQYASLLHNFDSFGIWADSSASTDLTRTHVEWFDNMKYTVVPEPSAALLLPFAAGLFLLARRKFRREKC